jgi:hypothetical protein
MCSNGRPARNGARARAWMRRAMILGSNRVTVHDMEGQQASGMATADHGAETQ